MIDSVATWFIKSFQDKSPEWISAIAAVVSVLGLLLVWRQLSLTKKIIQLAFKDVLEKENRDLVAKIPTKALLGSDLYADQYREIFDEFFRYFDLSNTQIILRRRDRIGLETWNSWRLGMKFNFSLPAFDRAWAWAAVAMRTDGQATEFLSELKRLHHEKFITDPRDWKQVKR